MNFYSKLMMFLGIPTAYYLIGNMLNFWKISAPKQYLEMSDGLQILIALLALFLVSFGYYFKWYIVSNEKQIERRDVNDVVSV